jgi:hypothetical protein
LTPHFRITLNNQIDAILGHPLYTLHFHGKATGSAETPNFLMISFCSAVTSVDFDFPDLDPLLGPVMDGTQQQGALQCPPSPLDFGKFLVPFNDLLGGRDQSS